MKKSIFLSLLVIFPTFLYAQSINHTELKPFWQDLKTALQGGYGTKVIRLSGGKMKAPQIEKMMKLVQNNRCILSAVITSSSNEIDYNPDMNHFIFICKSLKDGQTFFTMQKNEKGFFRLVDFKTYGNIACPVTNVDNTSIYDKKDLLGTWNFDKIEWIEYSDSLQQNLTSNGYSEKNIQEYLNERVKEILVEKQENNFLMTIQKIIFTEKKMEVITSNNKEIYFWRLSYNQLQVRKNETDEWAVWHFNWRINKNRNLDFSVDDYNSKGNVKWGFVKSK